MMKREYVAPQVLEVNVETVNVLAASLYIDGETYVDTEEDGVLLSGRRRGKWGDLWESIPCKYSVWGCRHSAPKLVYVTTGQINSCMTSDFRELVLSSRKVS